MDGVKVSQSEDMRWLRQRGKMDGVKFSQSEDMS